MANSAENVNNEAISCIICTKLGSKPGPITNLGDMKKITRGITTFRAASNARQDGLIEFLQMDFVYAHNKCRQKYINKWWIKSQKNLKEKMSGQPSPEKKLRTSDSTSTSFDWGKNCFICGTTANEAVEKKKNKHRRKRISYIKSTTLNETLLDFVGLQKDNFCKEIHERISGIADLHSLGAKYHTDCYNFLNTSARSHFADKKTDPRVSIVNAAMEKIYDYIDANEDDHFTLQEFKKILSTERIPDDQTIKKRLISKYGDNVSFCSKLGSKTIICFRKKETVTCCPDIDTVKNEI